MSDVAYHAQHVVKIDPQTPLSCGFSTGYGAAWKEAKVEIGSSVAVFGLGAVGIIGIDKNSRKEAKGRAFGMTDFINPEESDKSIEELVRDLSDGMRVDYGVPSLINQAILSTKLKKLRAVPDSCKESSAVPGHAKPLQSKAPESRYAHDSNPGPQGAVSL
ncbi:hypothetical protein V6N13_148423 [Hibiscus sabdariffa]